MRRIRLMIFAALDYVLARKPARTRQSLLLVHQVFERFTGSKLDRFRGSDLDGVAGLGIAARARGACAGAEGAETDELNAVAVDNGLRHGRDKRIDSFSGCGFARTGGGRHGVNEFLLVHFCFLKDGGTTHSPCDCMVEASPYRTLPFEANPFSPRFIPDSS